MSHSSQQRYIVEPRRKISGELTVPGDKSISHRSLMFGGIAEGTTEITGFLDSEDCLATLKALQALGVRIERPSSKHVIVHGVGADGLRGVDTPLDMGNAGTAMRLFMGLLAGQRFKSTLIGDSSLMRRPMERAAVPLRQMGARIQTKDGKPPVEIDGHAPLKAVTYSMPVASAQVKSSILLATLKAEGITRVTEPAPSRDHTERMLGAFGVKISREGSTVVLEGGQQLKGGAVQVPSDFSSAAFFIVAGCLAAEDGLLIKNVGVNPTRTGLIDMLRMMGADIRLRPPGSSAPLGTSFVDFKLADDHRGEPIVDIEVRASQLRGVTVPESLVPLSIDEFPAFFIAAAAAEGETTVTGAHELRVKESDRLAAMAEGLGVLGVEHQLLTDGLTIQGAGEWGGGVVDSHGDHRIAMSFAIASLRAKAPIEVLDVANVATSFPSFVDLARSVGLHFTRST